MLNSGKGCILVQTGIQTCKLAVLILILLLFPALLLSALFAQPRVSPQSISYALMDKSLLNITLVTVNPGIHTLAADSGNGLVVRVQVSSAGGDGFPGAEVRLEASGHEGSFQPSEGITDGSGSFLSIYTPPTAKNGGLNISAPGSTGSGSSSLSLAADADKLTLTARLIGTEKSSSLLIKLVPVPVVLIHGYKASPALFSGLSEYLRTEGYTPFGFSYASETGIAASAADLSDYLHKKTLEFDSDGVQISRFDLVAHSMGGLVARYYTCGSMYASRGNVRKLIFISVPQKGSPFASLGLQHYSDRGIRDLAPDSELYTSFFPSMINAGLNPSIQTGSLLGRFDEVVGAESANLAEWKIETELFELGDNNFTADKLLTGEILKAANHKLVLYNKKVYERVRQMLESAIPYPAAK